MESGKLSEEKGFKDPVHRYIRVTDRLIWELIGTKEFQRLRRIKQLGTTYLTFHGAEHSRFNHSLGVYEIVRRIVDDVFAHQDYWDVSERLVCLCAALLHDLGHGPFSHSFEKVFQLDHEEFTTAILLGDTEINKVLRQNGNNFPQKIADVIAKKYENKLVVNLISSQMDADRMDYLLRDAYYTGVSYGNFDLERILRVMRPHKDQVVIKKSGMHAVEHYVMSRYQMYLQIYFHPVTRSAEVLLTKIIHRAKHLHQEGYSFKTAPLYFQCFFNNQMNIEEYLRLDESIVLYYFQSWQEEKDSILRDLCSRFLNRHLFKYIEFNPSADNDKLLELISLFKQANIDPDYYLVVDSSSDLPYDIYRPGSVGEKLPIHLLMPNGDLRELSNESPIVNAISGKLQTDHKLYFPHDMVNDCTDVLRGKINGLLYGSG